VVGSAREGVVVVRTAAALQPHLNAGSSGLKQFELHRAAGSQSRHGCTRPHPTAADQIADPQPNDVTAPQLAVDR
jgi:hypothetical protein